MKTSGPFLVEIQLQPERENLCPIVANGFPNRGFPNCNMALMH
jgi:hypothetical protein